MIGPKHPILLSSLSSQAARRSRERSVVVGLGLIALSGTSVFATFDQLYLRAASAHTPCRALEEKGTVAPPLTTVEKYRATVAEPERASGPVIPSSAETSMPAQTFAELIDPPATNLASAPANRRMSVQMQNSVATTQLRDALVVGAASETSPAVSEEPETTGALVKVRSPASWPRGATAPTGAAEALITGALGNCPAPALRAVLADVSARFGELIVVATHEHKVVNHRSGSTREKLHHGCMAVDFRPDRRRIKEVTAYLRGRREIGGVESYRDGVIHMDLARVNTHMESARLQ